MAKRSRTAAAAFRCGAAVLAWVLAGPSAKAPAADREQPAPAKGGSQEVFGLTKVRQLHLQLSAKEWERMQPVGGMRFPGGPGGPGGFGGPGGPGGPGGKPADKPGEEPVERHKGSGFGIEFPWAHGELTEDGRTYKDVGVRFKGNASYMASARGLKRNFKIELDHYDKDQRYQGLKTINLNAGAMDPTRGREALSFAVFRAAGVPAPRTAYAAVTLTVPGKYDHEFLGLYTLIEQVDRTFLKDRFKNNKGLLMKPEGVRGVQYLGEDWDRYKGPYRPKHEPAKKEARRLIAFARLVNRADDAEFRKEIDAYLDVDEFLRFLAVNALLVNLDSFFVIGHNYYLYLNTETNKFVFIPWDMDLSCAGFPMGGSPDQQLDLSLTHPHAGENKLIDRLLAIKEVNERYRKILKELAENCFSKDRLLRDVAAIEKATMEVRLKEAKAAQARKEGGGFGFGPPGGGMFGRSIDLRTFIIKRTESVVAQLDGTRKGFVPAMGFGPGGPGGPPGGPGGFGIGNMLARPLLETLDGNRDGKVSRDEWLAGVKNFFRACDRDNKDKLDERALADGLNRLFPQPPGFGPPGGGPGGPPGGPGRPGGGPPGGPGGPGAGPGRPGGGPGGPGGFGGPRFGPGQMLANAVVRRADTNKDGVVTLDELVAAAEALFKECDKDKNGSLDEKEIAAGIGLLMPGPPGFGPPGGGPPGGRPGEPRKDDKKEEKKP
jgi:spore coat protein CotH